MRDIGVLVSTLIGLLCAAGGILARPRTPSPENRVHTILAAAAAAIPVLGWILFVGHPLATGLSFLACTLVAGELRDLQHKISTRHGATDDVNAALADKTAPHDNHEHDQDQDQDQDADEELVNG